MGPPLNNKLQKMQMFFIYINVKTNWGFKVNSQPVIKLIRLDCILRCDCIGNISRHKHGIRWDIGRRLVGVAGCTYKLKLAASLRA